MKPYWWAMVAGVGLAVATLGANGPGSELETGSTGQGPNEAASVAALATRLHPNGVPAVVICAQSRVHDVDCVAGQALAERLGGALLVSQSRTALGSATEHALTALEPPALLSPNTGVQPYQPTASKPAIYLVGGPNAIGHTIASQLRSDGYQVIRIWGANASQTLAAVEKFVMPEWPAAADQVGFPNQWPVYAGSQDHNAFYPAPANAPSWEKTGVRWSFPEGAAVPLNAPYPDLSALGLRNAPVKMTQYLGNAVGVTAVGGVIYAESDDNHLYALNAQTGQLLWQVGPLVNTLMGDPVVARGLVFVTAGDTGFSFSQVLRYFNTKGQQPLTRGLMYSAIYAFNARTGRLVWRQDFRGEAMATPTVVGNTIYEATGGGHLWAFDAETGEVRWRTNIHGFDSMSSANYWTNPQSGQTEILVGVTDPNQVVAVDAATGKILWTQGTTLDVFNTGMGDNSPTVDATGGVIIQDAVVDFNQTDKTCDLAVFAMDAATGKVLWATKLGRGPAPPAYKAGVAMVHHGTVFVGSPVTSTYYALNEATGQILWRFPLGQVGPAGSGRGSAVWADGILWVAAGPTVFAIDPSTGKPLGSLKPGGRFGIVNPVIVGGTMYLDNSYDWVQAIPLGDIDPTWHPSQQ